MTVSLAEATAAARRIREGDHPAGSQEDRLLDYSRDADLLAGFVLAGDTERLRTALENVADGIEEYTGPVRQLAKIARNALAENES